MTRMNLKEARPLALLLVLLSAACGQAQTHSDSHDEPGEHGDREGEDADHDAEEEHEGEVHLGTDAIQASGIEVGAVERRALIGGAGLPAEVRLDPLSTAHVSPLVRGRVTEISVALGERVEAGQLLATVASEVASDNGAQLGQLRAQLRAAEARVTRQRELVSQSIAARRALIDAEATVAGLQARARGMSRQLRVLRSGEGGQLRLLAPIAGVVVQVHATPGETARVDEPAFTIADPSAVSVYVQVPELAIARMEEGLVALFRPHAFPSLAFEGRVQYISPTLDRETRSLSVRVALTALDARLRGGMFGTLEIIGDERRPLAIPTNAVVTMDGAPTVFVPADAENAFRPVPVRIGRRAGAFYELLDGPAEGGAIVVAGAFTLKAAMSTSDLAEHEH